MPEEKTSRANIAARIAGVGVIALAAIAINSGWLKSGNPQPSRVNNDYIEQETAKLVGKPRTITLTAEKAIAARNAIKKGDYAAARKIADDVLAGSQMQYWRFYPFNILVDNIVTENDPTFLENLNKWIEKDKNYAIAYLIRGEYYYSKGWGIRGHKFVSETQSDHMDWFGKYMQMAEADIRKAIELDSKNPYNYLALLNIMYGYGNSPKMEQAFQEAIKKFPNYYGLYITRLITLYPEWGGSPEEMYSFVNKYAGGSQANSPLKLLYVRLYANLTRLGARACARAADDQKKNCIASVMGQLVSRELESNVHNALNLYNTTDKYQFTVALEGILTDIVASGADEYSGTLVHLAAQAMDSDNQLVKDNSKHNNYMMDKVAGFIWYKDKYYDNAEQKYKEALADIKYMDFPNEEEKYIALSDIFDRLSGVYNKTAQYENLIIYENAAIAMGGNIQNGSRHLVCYGYYKLKNYAEAVKQCTIQLDNGGDMQTRYWRATANTELGNTEEALKDFAIVADSEDDDFRSHAAISMSVIYGKRNDIKNQLASLNNHPYLFDEKTQTKDTLMVSYNNRCYGYMKLGELQKALDDCNASLRFGNLPDAYQKQQELIKKINEQKNKI